MPERHVIPLTHEESAAVNKAVGKAIAFVSDALQPYGISALDLVMPEWHRIVEDDGEPQPAPVKPEPTEPLVQAAEV